MSTVVIHLGPHKTGTTYIQTGLAANADLLAAHGIVYDVADDPAGVNHSPLAGRFATEPTTAAEEVAGWAPAAVRCISSENLSYLGIDQWRTLREAVPAHVDRVCFVAFRRRRADAVHSQWAEAVRWGETRPFPEWLATEILDPDPVPALHLSPLLERLPLAAGDELVVVDYDGLRHRGVDLVAFFATELLGYPEGLELRTGTERNASLPIAATELVRLLQVTHRLAGGEPGIDLFLAHKAARESSSGFEAMAASLQAAIDANLTTIDLRGLDDLFASRDEAFARRWGGHVRAAVRAPVPTPGRDRKAHLDHALLLEPAVRHVLDRLHLELLSSPTPGGLDPVPSTTPGGQSR